MTEWGKSAARTLRRCFPLLRRPWIPVPWPVGVVGAGVVATATITLALVLALAPSLAPVVSRPLAGMTKAWPRNKGAEERAPHPHCFWIGAACLKERCVLAHVREKIPVVGKAAVPAVEVLGLHCCSQGVKVGRENG